MIGRVPGAPHLEEMWEGSGIMIGGHAYGTETVSAIRRSSFRNLLLPSPSGLSRVRDRAGVIRAVARSHPPRYRFFVTGYVVARQRTDLEPGAPGLASETWDDANFNRAPGAGR